MTAETTQVSVVGKKTSSGRLFQDSTDKLTSCTVIHHGPDDCIINTIIIISCSFINVNHHYWCFVNDRLSVPALLQFKKRNFGDMWQSFYRPDILPVMQLTVSKYSRISRHQQLMM